MGQNNLSFASLAASMAISTPLLLRRAALPLRRPGKRSFAVWASAARPAICVTVTAFSLRALFRISTVPHALSARFERIGRT